LDTLDGAKYIRHRRIRHADVMLTTFLGMPHSLSWRAIHLRTKEYYSLFCCWQTGMIEFSFLSILHVLRVMGSECRSPVLPDRVWVGPGLTRPLSSSVPPLAGIQVIADAPHMPRPVYSLRPVVPRPRDGTHHPPPSIATSAFPGRARRPRHAQHFPPPLPGCSLRGSLRVCQRSRLLARAAVPRAPEGTQRVPCALPPPRPPPAGVNSSLAEHRGRPRRL